MLFFAFQSVCFFFHKIMNYTHYITYTYIFRRAYASWRFGTVKDIQLVYYVFFFRCSSFNSYFVCHSYLYISDQTRFLAADRRVARIRVVSNLYKKSISGIRLGIRKSNSTSTLRVCAYRGFPLPIFHVMSDARNMCDDIILFVLFYVGI